ncbi:MAG: hypothetical protein ABJO86_00810 [Lentilitoribacter sp.]
MKLHTQISTISDEDYELSCQFSAQLLQPEKEDVYNARQSISDFADRQAYFTDRFPNLWNEICNDIANLAIGQPLTKPIILGAGYTLETALRYMRAKS